ncbi:MAG: glycerol-3-phosphate acyltransferase [Promethearchaeota archaeon]
MIEILFAGLLGYLMGSIFISYLLVYFIKGIDLTKAGTGQLGASNTGRILGWQLMGLVGLFDILKATIALFIIKIFFEITPYYDAALIFGSCGIIFGHIKSLLIWLHKKEWHGGKGGAPLGGVVLFLSWESFFVLYVILMPIIQLGKKIGKEKSLYDNFIPNAIIGFFIPFVIFYFTGKALYLFIIILLLGIIVYSEREKVKDIIFPQSDNKNFVFRISFIFGSIQALTMSIKKKLKIHSKEDPNGIKIPLAHTSSYQTSQNNTKT